MKIIDRKSLIKRIPIIIYKSESKDALGWRCEIADCYESFKPKLFQKINFEDLSFHFKHPTLNIEGAWPNLVEHGFRTKKDAIDAAKFCNEKYLSGKAKLWRLF